MNLNGKVIGVHVVSFRVPGFGSFEVPSSFIQDLLDWFKNEAGGRIFLHDDEEVA